VFANNRGRKNGGFAKGRALIFFQGNAGRHIEKAGRDPAGFTWRRPMERSRRQAGVGTCRPARMGPTWPWKKKTETRTNNPLGRTWSRQ